VVIRILIKFSRLESKAYFHGFLIQLIREGGQGAGVLCGLENQLVKIDIL
jgi:hypothetical protein